jgi:hypothetical protein
MRLLKNSYYFGTLREFLRHFIFIEAMLFGHLDIRYNNSYLKDLNLETFTNKFRIKIF